MEEVSLTPRIEVNIYKVSDVDGNDLAFAATVDYDGDIVITLEESTCNEEVVKDYAMDNMDELINGSCETGLRLCLETIKAQHPNLFSEVAEDD